MTGCGGCGDLVELDRSDGYGAGSAHREEVEMHCSSISDGRGAGSAHRLTVDCFRESLITAADELQRSGSFKRLGRIAGSVCSVSSSSCSGEVIGVIGGGIRLSGDHWVESSSVKS